MESRPSTHEELQAEVQEIYAVLRRQDPDRPTFELWTEALSLHRVRYETDVLALDEEGNIVNLGRIDRGYPQDAEDKPT
jgi:hypothetical protein